MDTSYSIDSMRSHNAQMSHVDFLDIPFLDQRHPAHAVRIIRVNLSYALGEEKRQQFYGNGNVQSVRLGPAVSQEVHLMKDISH